MLRWDSKKFKPSKKLHISFFIFLNFFKLNLFAQGPLPLNNPPFSQGKPFSNKAIWKEIPEFKNLKYPKAYNPEVTQILKNFSIDSNNIHYEFKKTFASEKTQIFHIPFRVDLIDYKKSTGGAVNGNIYRLQGLLTLKAESKGQALIQIQNLSSDQSEDFGHLLELKADLPLYIKKVLETQSEIINSILKYSSKSP